GQERFDRRRRVELHHGVRQEPAADERCDGDGLEPATADCRCVHGRVDSDRLLQPVDHRLSGRLLSEIHPAAFVLRHLHVPAPSTLRGVGACLRGLVPEGRRLPERVWSRRHRGILVLLWMHAVGIAVFAAVRQFEVSHVLLEAGAVGVTAVLAGVLPGPRRLRSVIACFGLMTSSALLVHLSGGYIEFHFHFFVMVGLLALYQDWTTFILAIGYVVVHH